jgi:hypothetical protein
LNQPHDGYFLFAQSVFDTGGHFRLAKTEKDRRHLLLRKSFKSLLDDGIRFAEKMALEEGQQP